MSIPEIFTSSSTSSIWRQTKWQRLVPLAISIFLLFILAFYAAINQVFLEHNILLEGADWSGYALCHRITERSFTINGRQFPLCARCSGMYLGVALTTTILIGAGRMRRALLPPKTLLLILLSFIALMGIDGLNSYSHFFPNAPHLYEPRNWLRLLTGLGTGVAMGLLLIPALAQTLWRSPQYVPVIKTKRELSEILVVALLIAAILLSNFAPLNYVLAVISVVGLLFILASLNCVILLVLTKKDGRSVTSWQTAAPMLIGLALGIIQISLLSAIRYNLTGTMTGFPGL